ncbi:MAG: CBS domain-containing protein [Elusimicrobia bacterium]|nr:CBS domain-containing protein [Elusimicrobiota bacterium]
MAHTAKLLICDVVCVSSGQTVSEAAKVMKKANIGAVIVGTMAAPEGILTERDILMRVVAEGLDPAATKVAKVMTQQLITVDSSQPLDKVFERLAQGRFRHLPITDGGKVVGIVSLSDLSKVLQEVYREDRYLQYFADVIAAR